MAAEQRAARSPVWGALGVLVVLVSAAYLFAANVRLQGGDDRRPQDLVGLVQAELVRAEESASTVAELRAEVDALAAAQGVTPVADPELDRIAQAAGAVAVSGPGLTVRLSDAPTSAAQPEWVTNDDLVVHQQDLQAVINALWAGGAEAMALQDQRVVSTSAYRCVGNVLLLHDRHYSPPYEVRAIGDPDELREALLASPAIQTYLDWADAVGLGWSVDESALLELPAYEATLDLRYARVPAGTAVPGEPSG